jgi:hypothetical protein
LCLVPGVNEIFGHSSEESEHIKYANWLSMVQAGVQGLEMFSPASMEWKQAHSQARYWNIVFGLAGDVENGKYVPPLGQGGVY